jgi:hypothetical protein
MARPKYFDIDPPVVDADGIAEAQVLGGAGNLILNGALCDLGTALQFDIVDSYSDDISGVIISIDSIGDISTVNFTVTGKNEYGVDTTEVITGVTTTEVQSTNYWSQITQIAADASFASNANVGTVDEFVTRMMPLNHYATEPATVSVSGLVGTCNFDIDESFSDMSEGYPSVLWVGAQVSKTADLAAELTRHAAATRLVFNSYASGAELQFAIHQNGNV